MKECENILKPDYIYIHHSFDNVFDGPLLFAVCDI